MKWPIFLMCTGDAACSLCEIGTESLNIIYEINFMLQKEDQKLLIRISVGPSSDQKVFFTIFLSQSMRMLLWYLTTGYDCVLSKFVLNIHGQLILLCH
jgi:hypothetical protein